MHIIQPSSRERQAKLIDDWLQDLVERDREATTIETYEGVIRRAHRELAEGLPVATADEIRAFIWVPGRAASSRKVYRAAIGSFFEWANNPANPRLDFNPMPLIPRVSVKPGRPRPITADALADILARSRPPYRMWYLLAAGAGLRCVEISRLDREHITEDQIWVNGKGSKEACIPTHPAIWAAAQQLPRGPVATTRDGDRAGRRAISNRGGRVLTELGYPDVTMHRLRHYFGTQVRHAAGGDLLIAQEGLRHASPSQTAGYTAYLPKELVAAVRGVPLPV